MGTSQLTLGVSPVWVLACLACGAGYAWLMYSKKVEWPLWLNRALSVVRFVLIAILCFLLLDPVIDQVKNTYEDPIVAVVVDDSESMSIVEDSIRLRGVISSLRQSTQALAETGVNVQWHFLKGSKSTSEKVLFDVQGSNLKKSLEILDIYDNSNLGAVVVVSDGIYTEGISPDDQIIEAPLVTISVGDTAARTDVSVSSVFYNKVAYFGNEFEIKADLVAKGLAGKKIDVDLIEDGEVLETKSVNISQKVASTKVSFKVSSENIGTRHYVVRAKEVSGEFTLKNNERHAYVDIIDTRQKILLLAQSPHPDIKALRSIVADNEELQLDINVLPLNREVSPYKEYSLIVLHNLPGPGLSNAELAKIKSSGVPLLWIVGSQTNLKAWNSHNDIAQLVQQKNQTDEVGAILSEKFEEFEFKLWNNDLFLNAPPLVVPFGQIKIKGNAKKVFDQRIGAISNDKPLVVVGDVLGRKSGVMFGEGYWRWRLYESLETDKTEVFDATMMKLMQYLAIRDNKKKFRVSSLQEEYLEGAIPRFSIQAFNDVYDELYDVKVSMDVTGENQIAKEFSFVTARGIEEYKIEGLPEGVYSYAAKASILGKDHVERGSFIVKKLRIEEADLDADHGVMKRLAINNKGDHYYSSQESQIRAHIEGLELKKRIHSTSNREELIHFLWIFIAVVALLTLEWTTRKIAGSY